MTYTLTFSGFRDDDPAVIFRVRDKKSGEFVRFFDGDRLNEITTLFFRENDHTGVVEWTDVINASSLTNDNWHDLHTLTPVSELPGSWPLELREFLVEQVAELGTAK